MGRSVTFMRRGVSSKVHITFSYDFFFFFSSRRRHTRLVSDWSSDVCSSDLRLLVTRNELRAAARRYGAEIGGGIDREQIHRGSSKDSSGWRKRPRRLTPAFSATMIVPAK